MIENVGLRLSGTKTEQLFCDFGDLSSFFSHRLNRCTSTSILRFSVPQFIISKQQGECRNKGRSKKVLTERVRNDMCIKCVNTEMTIDSLEWTKKPCCTDYT